MTMTTRVLRYGGAGMLCGALVQLPIVIAMKVAPVVYVQSVAAAVGMAAILWSIVRERRERAQ